MSIFVYKLVPPRPTFAQTMTEQEVALMQEHVGYWGDLVGKGIVILFGGVADPTGVWGLAVVDADNEDQVRGYGTNDPAIKARIGFQFGVFPMLQVTLRVSLRA